MNASTIIRLGHGYYGGGVEADVCPAITTSSWEWNNLLAEVYEDDLDTDEGEERGGETA